MAAKIIDGRQVAASIRQECKARVAALREHRGVTPGLAVILVGDNPASAVYVGSKIKACAEVGIRSFKKQYPASIDEDTLITAIEGFNRDPNVHGILVQLPLPPHIDMRRVLKTIDASKDVDGFHLYN
ncbi:MAG TPA: tetrahydrofolate dehydrogenase/cyclohydrolase catalytic domain-containing protein, partial [Steroidobacteraceae bacterium]|nr:tetrahydrofolate dehydrogenase/cyclohydrolase catalytic domain-containing protein [Steroidobacteraceae bacterium]